jgi:hypothetical protein
MDYSHNFSISVSNNTMQDNTMPAGALSREKIIEDDINRNIFVWTNHGESLFLAPQGVVNQIVPNQHS